MNTYLVMTMIVRKQPTQEVLEHIYKTIQKNISNQECYYTEEEIKELKKDKQNNFFKGEK